MTELSQSIIYSRVDIVTGFTGSAIVLCTRVRRGGATRWDRGLFRYTLHLLFLHLAEEVRNLHTYM